MLAKRLLVVAGLDVVKPARVPAIVPGEKVESILAGLRAGTIDWAQIEDPRVAILASGEESLNTTRAPALSYHLFGLNSAREPFTRITESESSWLI